MKTGTATAALVPYMTATIAVAVWMVIGATFRLDPNSYLLVGVPLVIAYQLFVRRKDLGALWVFRSTEQVLGKRSTVALGLLLAVAPVTALADAWKAGSTAAVLWCLCSLAGAPVAAWTISRTSPRDARSALPNVLSVVLVGAAVLSAATATSGGRLFPGLNDLPQVGRDALLFFTVCFILEEVAFRGAIDQHLSDSALRGARCWLSAIYASLLWGLWHFPLVFRDAATSSTATAVQVLALHLGIGGLLSLIARQSGSLALSAGAHALLDAWRDALVA